MNGQKMRDQTSYIPMRSLIGTISLVVVICIAGESALAQYDSDFESPMYKGSVDGTIITDQDGFYIPIEGSQDGMVFKYADNALGIPQNPNGGDQFAGLIGGAPNLPEPFARAQRDMVYGDGTGIWTVSFDIAATFIGELPSAQVIGSFSTQVTLEEATFVAVARWSNPTSAETWYVSYHWYTPEGVKLEEEIYIPGFKDLLVKHWYRLSTTFNLESNLITEITITDLATDTTGTFSPVNRYLYGGAEGAPAPSGFRLFAGSDNVAGNVLAFDNVDIVFDSQCPWDLNSSGSVDTSDLLALLAQWGTAGPADFDGSGAVGKSDLLILFANWGPCE